MLVLTVCLAGPDLQLRSRTTSTDPEPEPTDPEPTVLPDPRSQSSDPLELCDGPNRQPWPSSTGGGVITLLLHSCWPLRVLFGLLDQRFGMCSSAGPVQRFHGCRLGQAAPRTGSPEPSAAPAFFHQGCGGGPVPGAAGLCCVLAWFFPRSHDDTCEPAGLDVLPAFLPF